MAQFARPDADTLVDNWTEDDGSTDALWGEIDEASASDTDYIQTQLAPTNDVYVARLSDVTDPVSSANHTVRVRHSKDAAGGATVSLTVQLRQGYVNEGSQGTLIATIMSAVVLSETWTTTSYTLSGAEADAITDYSALFLRMVANQS